MPDQPAGAERGAGSLLRLLSQYGISAALIFELLLFSQLSPYFFTAENLLNVTLQVSITAIIAVGMTFVILTSGIDLSVGAIVAMSGVLTTSLMKMQAPLPVVFLLAGTAGILLGALSGWFAGICITKLNITPFIVTMSLMTIWRGAAFLVTDGRPIWELPHEFSLLGSGRIGPVPFPSVVMIVIYVTAFVVLTRTAFGRYVYAAGGNREAARLSGIRTDRIIISAYIISGALAAVSGILLASRMNSGQPNAGLMYELDVIAAVVVGGTSLFGGRGSIVGTFLGAMLIGILRNGLNLLNVSSYLQMIVLGVVILLAVMLDQIKTRK
ncbi:MAG TPA: ribose ABC transporter permease [Bacteroidota bacterium]|nr:ribose ABC transporter permease [Bacteroidota bacterium]